MFPMFAQTEIPEMLLKYPGGPRSASAETGMVSVTRTKRVEVDEDEIPPNVARVSEEART